MGIFTNALQQYQMGRNYRQQEEQRKQQDQNRSMLGQMLQGGESGNLAQADPQMFMQGQNFLAQKQQAQQAQAQQQQAKELFSRFVSGDENSGQALAQINPELYETAIGQMKRREEIRSSQEETQFNQDLESAAGTGDFFSLTEKYPQYSEKINDISNQRDELISSGLGGVSAQVYNALERGDSKNVFDILESNKDKLDSFGDPSFNYEQARELAIKNPDQLKKLALQTAKMTGTDLGNPSQKPMTEYQKNQIDLRRIQADIDKAKNKIAQENNVIKKQQMQADLDLKNKKLADLKTKSTENNFERFKNSNLVIEEGQRQLDLIDRIENSPGFSEAIGAKGASSLYGYLDSPIGGTEAANVVADLSTLESKNFLAAIKSFKAAGGAGSLSDAEGQKLSSAMSSLTRNQTESNIKRQFKIIRDIVTKQISVAKQDKKRYKLPNQNKTKYQSPTGITFTVE